MITNKIKKKYYLYRCRRVAKSYGAWNWAAYFSAQSIETVKSGAEVYSGILRGEKTGVEHCAISYWCKADDPVAFENIIQKVASFQHPIFDLTSPEYEDVRILVSPTALLNTAEMSVGMALPQKSIPGLPVFESVEFGRSVTTYDASSKKQIEFGQVSHFGSEEGNPDGDLRFLRSGQGHLGKKAFAEL